MKTPERIKKYGEVFTPDLLVNQMLSKLPKEVWKKGKTSKNYYIEKLRKNMMGIYAIVNLINNKAYFGSGHNLRRRRIQHLWELKNNIHKNPHLQHSFNKYGIENFVFIVIKEVESSDLLKMEQFYIDVNTNGYNISKNAYSTRLGMKHSQYTKDKISKSKLGKSIKSSPKSEEHKKKLSESNKGKKLSEETKKKMSDSNKGKIISQETRKKIRLSLSGKKRPPEIGKKISQALTGKKHHRKQKGFYYHHGKWEVGFSINGKFKYFGSFLNEMDAMIHAQKIKMELGLL